MYQVSSISLAVLFKPTSRNLSPLPCAFTYPIYSPVPGRKPGDSVISQLLAKGVYDILALPEDGDLEIKSILESMLEKKLQHMVMPQLPQEKKKFGLWG